MTRHGWLERVAAEEKKILAEEGIFHVAGRYFPTEHLASVERRWTAEVRASKAIARDALRRQGCTWCGHIITDEQASVSFTDAEVHTEPCSREFAAFTGESPRPSHRTVLACDMSDPVATQSMTQTLFDLNPTCSHCGNQVDRVGHATALFVNRAGEWRLFHQVPVGLCAVNAVAEENEILAGNAVVVRKAVA